MVQVRRGGAAVLLFSLPLAAGLQTWMGRGSRRQLLQAITSTTSAAFVAQQLKPTLPASAALADVSSLTDGGALYIFPILQAQKDARVLLEDEQTFRTMITIGLPTSGTSVQVPPNLSFSLFKRIENSAIDPGEFMDAAIEYIEYTRDANDLVELARMARTNGGGRLAVADYLDRAVEAVKGSDRALARMVPLLPKVK
jgi:hypothetical protein